MTVMWTHRYMTTTVLVAGVVLLLLTLIRPPRRPADDDLLADGNPHPACGRNCFGRRGLAARAAVGPEPPAYG
jgi:hypothetical protein